MADTLDVIVCWAADGAAGRARELARGGHGEDLARLTHSVQQADEVVVGWAVAALGRLVDRRWGEGAVVVPAAALADAAATLARYEGAAGVPASAGVGATLAEAAKALEVAQRRGGDHVVVFDEGTDTELQQVRDSGMAKGEELPPGVESLEKMALIHNNARKPAKVYRIMNAEGEGPYGGTTQARVDDIHQGRGANTGDPGFDAPMPHEDFVPKEFGHSFDGDHIYGFAHPEDAVAWHGEGGLQRLYAHGYRLKEVPASRVYLSQSGKQVLFKPHRSYNIDEARDAQDFDHSAYEPHSEEPAEAPAPAHDPWAGWKEGDPFPSAPASAAPAPRQTKRGNVVTSSNFPKGKRVRKGEGDDLEKMALLDNPKGRRVRRPKGEPVRIHDYDHLLPAGERGYHLRVHHNPAKDGKMGYIGARLSYQDPYGGEREEVGELDAMHETDNNLHISSSSLAENHQGRGLGKAMYEAVLSHAAHNGVKTVSGSGHTVQAHGVHASLARKHGLAYQATRAEGADEDREDYGAGSYGPYKYTLKAEADQDAANDPDGDAPAFEPSTPVSAGLPADPAAAEPLETTGEPPAPAAELPISVADAAPPQTLQDQVRSLVQAKLEADRARLEGDATAAVAVRDRLADTLRKLHDSPEDLQALVQASPGMADTLLDLVATIRDLARVLPPEVRAVAKAEPDVEPLDKGAMQRLHPYDPTNRPEGAMHINNWLDSALQRGKVPEMPAGSPERERALHKLAAATTVRRAPNGKREFLLHRGMSLKEGQRATKTPGTFESVPPPGNTIAARQEEDVPHPGLSSWTPDHGIAEHFLRVYSPKLKGRYAKWAAESEYSKKYWPAWRHQEVNRELEKLKAKAPVIHSVWVNEDQIHNVPRQYGRTAGREFLTDEKWVPGPQRLGWEHEVIVKPGRFQQATPEEVAQAKAQGTPEDKLKEIQDRYRARDEQDKQREVNQRADLDADRSAAVDPERSDVVGRWIADGAPHSAIKPEAKTEPVAKAAGVGGSEVGREHVIRPVGAISADGKVKVPFSSSGGKGWRQARSGVVTAPDGTPTSAHDRNPATGQLQIG